MLPSVANLWSVIEDLHEGEMVLMEFFLFK